MTWTLCIDFGTAYSKAAAAPTSAWMDFKPSLVRPLILSEEGGFLLDSAIFLEEERVLFGAAAVAREAELSDPKRSALRSFKTILGASDLERALENNAPRSIDPVGIFQMRDLLVLYLAFLSAAIERAVAADPVIAGVDSFSRRYAAPVWRATGGHTNHNLIARLFDEANVVGASLGKPLLSPAGVSISAVRKALTLVKKKAPAPVEMGLIFEATAAAAYTSIGLDHPARHLIVLDMGAGTTDIAAVARTGEGLRELPAARVTLKEAGDFIDRVIANMALDQCRHLKTRADQALLWRAVFRSTRDIKESLFVDGRALFRFDQRMLKFTMADLQRQADFKAFMASLTASYERGLDAVGQAASEAGAREILSVAVGGGAYAPFVQALIRKSPRRGKIRVIPRPATPAWAHAEEFGGNLAPVFPQLAIAIGGALAPDSMLAARG